LHDLLCGPVDWTTSAAILATCNLARTEPLLSRPVCELLSPLLSINGGPIHWANITEPLERCADWIADPSPRLTRWVERVRATQAKMVAGA
jgi:hypothetical protein